jgi:3-oxoacid CoA-transferase subunit A
MIYLTGDTHGDFSRIYNFCKNNKTTISDTMVILGDAGLNYYINGIDLKKKHKLSALPITIFCIHGNHECRPRHIPTYEITEWREGLVYLEKEYLNILFAKDGEIYNLDDQRVIVIGGAYSVDKYYRLARNACWWEDEQPSDTAKQKVERTLINNRWNVDFVLSHTCPRKYEPIEAFLSFIDQSKVDKTTEDWLDHIEDNLTYKKWYCGHYHIDKSIDNIRFLQNDIVTMGCSK